MELFDFLDFHLIDLIDIVLVAFLLYYVYKLLKDTVAMNIFFGIVIIYIIYLVTEVLGMRVLSNIFGKFIGVGFFALIVVFQQEIRKFLLLIGSTNIGGKKGLARRFRLFRSEAKPLETDVEVIVRTCEKMGNSHTGAIIVLERNSPLDFVKTTGDAMNIEVTQPILESIFFKNSPLHDGAVIIEDNLITATRVILPVSNENSIPLRFGLRHRAAVGITEKTDALALVVSEESGQISYIKNGEFVLFNSTEELIDMLKKDLV